MNLRNFPLKSCNLVLQKHFTTSSYLIAVVFSFINQETTFRNSLYAMLFFCKIFLATDTNNNFHWATCSYSINVSTTSGNICENESVSLKCVVSGTVVTTTRSVCVPTDLLIFWSFFRCTFLSPLWGFYAQFIVNVNNADCVICKGYNRFPITCFFFWYYVEMYRTQNGFLLVLKNVFLYAKRFFAVEDNCMVDNVFKCCKLFLAVVADKHVSENSRKVQFRIFLFYLHR